MDKTGVRDLTVHFERTFGSDWVLSKFGECWIRVSKPPPLPCFSPFEDVRRKHIKVPDPLSDLADSRAVRRCGRPYSTATASIEISRPGIAAPSCAADRAGLFFGKNSA